MDINKAAHHAGSIDLAARRLTNDGRPGLAGGCEKAAQFIRDLIPPKGLELPRMLVLSTSHIPKGVSDLLEQKVRGHLSSMDRAALPQAYEKGEYGFLLPLIDDDDCRERYSRLPPLNAIRELAETHGASWIMLDRDAETVAGLPTYDW